MPVYERKGLIYCVYYDGQKRIWEAFGRGEKAKSEAEARDLEIKLKKKRAQWQSNANERIPFKDLVELYLEDRKTELSDLTISVILYTINAYAKFLYPKPVASINMADWRQIQKNIMNKDRSEGKTVSNRTINTYFSYFSKIFAWAVEENDNILTENPWRFRKKLRSQKAKIDLFTLKEFMKIKKKAPTHVAWAMEVAYHTGVRPGPVELFSLKWEDVDWKNKRIRIHSTKTANYTGPWRWQYPAREFMTRLEERYADQKEKYPECPWIIHYNGKNLQSIKRAWAKAKKDAGITRPIRLYDIRHFYISYALAGGADIMELAERVGHTTPEMIIKVYAHLAKDLRKNQAFTLPNIYKKSGKP